MMATSSVYSDDIRLLDDLTRLKLKVIQKKLNTNTQRDRDRDVITPTRHRNHLHQRRYVDSPDSDRYEPATPPPPGCSSSNKPCLWDATIAETTETKCNTDAGNCMWCASQTIHKKKCQTNSFACVVAAREIIPGVPSGDYGACVAAGGVYCDGDVDKECIYDEPLFEICYKPGRRVACTTSAMDASACHAASCLWCGSDAIDRRKNQCWEKPDAECEGDETCCQTLKCGAPGISKTACIALGCYACRDKDDKLLCNYGSDPNPGSCSSSSKPCLWDATITETTQQKCEDDGKYCMWCPDESVVKKKCQTVDRSCLVTDLWEMDGHLNAYNCISAGGIFCNGDCAEKCIYPEPVDKICFKPGARKACENETASNKIECHEVGCAWCGSDSIEVRKDACWKIPDDGECDSGTCCLEHRCMDGLNPNATLCTGMGCSICDFDGDTLCVYN